MLSASGCLFIAALALMFLAKTEKSNPKIQSSTVNIQEVPRHPVTPQMEETAKNLAESDAPDFTLPTVSGAPFHLLDQLQIKPVLVIMTKDGCPCSIEAQPFFSQLADHYQQKLTTIGVIDSDKTGAQKFINSFKPPYDLAMSEDTEFFIKYKSKQSVYTYLIKKNGKLVKVWPGYSKASLIELNHLLSEETGLDPAELDLTMAPTKMTSGCFFFSEVGATEPSW